jgi:hypothetical protein
MVELTTTILKECTISKLTHLADAISILIYSMKQFARNKTNEKSSTIEIH